MLQITKYRPCEPLRLCLKLSGTWSLG